MTNGQGKVTQSIFQICVYSLVYYFRIYNNNQYLAICCIQITSFQHNNNNQLFYLFTAYSIILQNRILQALKNKRMEVQFTEEQIKTMFKIAKRLQSAFSDVKKLTTRYLLKVKKIQTRKIQAMAEEQERQKKQEHERRKKQKYEATRSRKDKQKQQKQKVAQIQKQKQLNQPKPIFSLIKQAKYKQKDQKKQKSKQKIPQTGKVQTQPQQQNKQQKLKQPQPPKIKTKILQKPTEPETPYFRFLRLKRNQIRSSVQNIPMQQTSKIMRTIWDKMTDQQRRPYVQVYELEKAKYERDMHNYYQNLYKKGGDKKKIEQKGKQQTFLSNFDFIDELDQM